MISPPHILASVVSPKAQFSALCSLSCILPHSVLLFHLFLYITTYTQMTHNFSSPSIHQISTPTSVTYKMLYNRSHLGWLPIFSLSTLLKLNLFLLDLNKLSDSGFLFSAFNGADEVAHLCFSYRNEAKASLISSHRRWFLPVVASTTTPSYHYLHERLREINETLL